MHGFWLGLVFLSFIRKKKKTQGSIAAGAVDQRLGEKLLVLALSLNQTIYFRYLGTRRAGPSDVEAPLSSDSETDPLNPSSLGVEKGQGSLGIVHLRSWDSAA